MYDSQIKALKKQLQLAQNTPSAFLAWNPDSETCRLVIHIGHAPLPKDGDEPEPSEVAYFDASNYVALYNCAIDEFIVATRLSF